MNHRAAVTAVVLECECGEILTLFFQDRRACSKVMVYGIVMPRTVGLGEGGFIELDFDQSAAARRQNVAGNRRSWPTKPMGQGPRSVNAYRLRDSVGSLPCPCQSRLGKGEGVVRRHRHRLRSLPRRRVPEGWGGVGQGNPPGSACLVRDGSPDLLEERQRLLRERGDRRWDQHGTVPSRVASGHSRLLGWRDGSGGGPTLRSAELARPRRPEVGGDGPGGAAARARLSTDAGRATGRGGYAASTPTTPSHPLHRFPAYGLAMRTPITNAIRGTFALRYRTFQDAFDLIEKAKRSGEMRTRTIRT